MSKNVNIMDIQRIIDTDIPDIAPVYGGVRGRSMSSKGLGMVWPTIKEAGVKTVIELRCFDDSKKLPIICEKFGIEGIIAIGGDGTFRGATDLTAHGVPCIGIPATIDNDITSTDNTIGFDTAMNTVVELVDKLRDTCESHARCNVVEVMGRGAGDIAISAGIASGATAIVVPEFHYDDNAIIAQIKESKAMGKRNFIILVSEGVGAEYGPELTKKIQAETGVESKFARPAHIVRGGSPTLKDRVLASTMGAIAVEELLKGHSNLVMCEKFGKIVPIDINYALILDRMYKNKLKDGDLDRFTEEDLNNMKADIKNRQAALTRLYGIAKTINR